MLGTLPILEQEPANPGTELDRDVERFISRNKGEEKALVEIVEEADDFD